MSFVPIRVRTLVPEIPLQFDLFIKLSAKYLLYVRGGDELSRSRLEHLRHKSVKQLFIESEAEIKYQQFLDQALINAFESPDMPAAARAETACAVATNAVEDIYENPESVETYRLVEKASTGIVNIVGKRTDVLKEFYKKVQASDADPLFRHAISVCSLVSCMAEKMQLEQKKMANLALASLVLDIGVTKMPEGSKKLFVKPLASFTKDDWELYRTHPILSAEVLNGKDYVNPEIIQMVLGHEERKSGLGFPKKIATVTKEQMLLGLCSYYDRMISCEKKSHKMALEEVQINQLGNFDLDMIKLLKTVLKEQNIDLTD